jgi:ribosomal-protein-serine acetyltransferase
MNHESIIINDQMRLIQLKPDQADILFELTDQNRDYLGQFLPWPPYVKTVDDSRKHIEETIQKRASGSSYTYGIEVEGKIAGDISIRHLDESEKTPEIGYWMVPEFAGKGLMTKAVQGLTEYSFRALGLDRIIIRAELANIGSNRVAEKAGYQRTGEDNEHGKKLIVWSASAPDNELY